MTRTPTPSTTLAALSALPQAGFVTRLGAIFEHSPWIAERAWAARPYASVDALHAAMIAVLAGASEAEQLGLIRAHPELAGKEAAAGTLTAASSGEQQGAGLDRCSAEELARLRRLNAAYRARFGFPCVIAVKGLGRHQIMAAMEARLNHDEATEFRACLAEIGKIARFRLDALLA
jgi:2-oxo-4-hydroxy-4-carboxy-5-ureidoimidazoline decarboxylase